MQVIWLIFIIHSTEKRNSQPATEAEMSTNRLFNVLIAIVLVMVVVLTVREAAARAALVSQTDSMKGANALECASLPSRCSIRTEYMKTTGTRLTYTKDGPTGVDGGLIYLLSAYRTCSR
jgi:hypothetical protein